MEYKFRRAMPGDQDAIWAILKDAIRRRKEDGSNQWQDGYPNPAGVWNDIENGYGFVLTAAAAVAEGEDEGEGGGRGGDDHEIMGYCAILINDEPAYADIEGEWLSNGDFVVFHRVAIAERHLGKGLAQKMLSYIEAFALSNDIKSVKADTNFDNIGMQKIFDKMGYLYCGEVVFRGSPRRAYEKVLVI